MPKRVSAIFIATFLVGAWSFAAAAEPDGSGAKSSKAPRPRLAETRNTGAVGNDPRWNEYGDYLNELTKVVQEQWYRILNESRPDPKHGSYVVITFKLNSEGEADIEKVKDIEAGKQGVSACLNAIQTCQPYRKWTEQMIAALGKEQTLTFAFYYE